MLLTTTSRFAKTCAVAHGNSRVSPTAVARVPGRIQDERGHARNFKLDAEMIDWLTRAGWSWLIGRSLVE